MLQVRLYGCGTTGAQVARLLPFVMPENSRLALCDPDIVNLQNVGRQGYTIEDQGKNKAYALKLILDKCIRHGPNLLYSADRSADFPLVGPDVTRLIVVSCIDNIPGRLEIARVAFNAVNTRGIQTDLLDLRLLHDTFRLVIAKEFNGGSALKYMESLPSEEEAAPQGCDVTPVHTAAIGAGLLVTYIKKLLTTDLQPTVPNEVFFSSSAPGLPIIL